MKLFHKTSALSFYMIHSGFMAFKARVKEELDAAGGGNLDDLLDLPTKLYFAGQPSTVSNLPLFTVTILVFMFMPRLNLISPYTPWKFAV